MNTRAVSTWVFWLTTAWLILTVFDCLPKGLALSGGWVFVAFCLIRLFSPKDGIGSRKWREQYGDDRTDNPAHGGVRRIDRGES